jgi:hypothetical protein
VSKLPDELQAEALKFILLYQFVEVDVKELKDYAHVIPKNEIIEPGGEGKIRKQLAAESALITARASF